MFPKFVMTMLFLAGIGVVVCPQQTQAQDDLDAKIERFKREFHGLSTSPPELDALTQAVYMMREEVGELRQRVEKLENQPTTPPTTTPTGNWSAPSYPLPADYYPPRVFSAPQCNYPPCLLHPPIICPPIWWCLY